MSRWQVMKAMDKPNKPVIQQVKYDMDSIETLKKATQANQKSEKLIFDYPTVYIVYDKLDEDSYEVYVGETNDIERRTNQHLTRDALKYDNWKRFLESEDSKMLVIAHDHFNKSLTLDVENTLMHYMAGIACVSSLDNRRENQQNHYYPESELKQIFGQSWTLLRKQNEELFPVQNVIQDTALFKVAPFFKLTDEQNAAIKRIMDQIETVLNAPDDGVTNRLIVIEGEAGAGKTVLMSTIFYLINQYSDEKRAGFEGVTSGLIVNNDEQVKVYETISAKLNLDKNSEVSRSTRFINRHSYEKVKGKPRKYDPSKRVDVTLVDESHLLLTRKTQSYQGTNQLTDIRIRSRVTIAIFDPQQVMKGESYLESKDVQQIRAEALKTNNLIQLHDQMRMQANATTNAWLRRLLDKRLIATLPHDDNYEVKVFQSAKAMHKAIVEKNRNWKESGLSRMVSTFDWEWHINDHSQVWKVRAGDLSLPWNYELEAEENVSELPWAEQPQTINEVGSTFTIQGFDLNYVGVIIGPSVKYRDGHIIFDPSASRNKNVTNQRTLANGEKKHIGEELLANELNVLMTRGVHGLYVYAVDEALREKLDMSVK